MLKVNEEFMTYVWQTKQFDLTNLQTIKGHEIIIKGFGQLNKGSGPDFDLAEVIIDDITWVGSVELHINAQDWHLHEHNKNANYDQVILHVVWERPNIVFNRNGEQIPTLWLKPLVNPKLLDAYKKLMLPKRFIPCESRIEDLDKFLIFQGLPKLFFQKQENKLLEIQSLYKNTNHNLAQTIFIYFMRYFGLSQNQEGFEHLAKQTPFRLLQKYKHNRTQLEALLFGQAQMIKGASEYARTLKSEYTFLKQKHNLKSIIKSNWRFSGRPASFPTVRIAQLAKLIFKIQNLVDRLINASSRETIQKDLSVETDSFWSKHYTFDGKERLRKKKIGKQFIDLLIINAIIPLQYFVSRKNNDLAMRENLENLILQVPPEKNKIINNWKKLNIIPQNGMDSQGLLHLYRTFCLQNNCLKCHVGHQVLKQY